MLTDDGAPGLPITERRGTANLFMTPAPLEGWRRVQVTDRHTALGYVQVFQGFSDTHSPDASKIVLGQDNLNTHKPTSLYEAFPVEEARRRVGRFEWLYTPRQGSSPDMAESERSVLATQCLDRRIADNQTGTDEVTAWEANRDTKHVKADSQFTTAGARTKRMGLTPHHERLGPLAFNSPNLPLH